MALIAGETPPDLRPGSLGRASVPVGPVVEGKPPEYADVWVTFVGWFAGYPWVRFVSPPAGEDNEAFVFSRVDYEPIATED